MLYIDRVMQRLKTWNWSIQWNYIYFYLPHIVRLKWKYDYLPVTAFKLCRLWILTMTVCILYILSERKHVTYCETIYLPQRIHNYVDWCKRIIYATIYLPCVRSKGFILTILEGDDTYLWKLSICAKNGILNLESRIFIIISGIEVY